MYPCPACREMIPADARRCRHCHVDLSPHEMAEGRKQARRIYFVRVAAAVALVIGGLYLLTLIVGANAAS